MPRDASARENGIKAKARRAHALARLDLRSPSSPRTAASGPTSHAVKTTDPATALAIETYLANKTRGQ